MSSSAKRRLGRLLPSGLITPGGFVWAAAILALAYFIFHGSGWREHAGFLSGTITPGGSAEVGLALGILYVLAYLAFVLLVPVLVLGAGIFALLLRAARRKEGTP